MIDVTEKKLIGLVMLVVELVTAPTLLFAETARILVSAPSLSLTWFPAFLAREQGFYRAEGLDVDFVVMKPQVALQAVVSGDVGYTTTLGSTIRAAIRGLPMRVVMTICEKPLFALIASQKIKSVEELKGKILGISSFGASSDTMARAVLRRYKLAPGQDVKILAVGGGTNRMAALQAGAIDAVLLEAPYNIMLERAGYNKLLFVGDVLPSPIAGFGTTLERIRRQPQEIQRLIRATLRGVRSAKSHKDENVRLIMKWVNMDYALAEGSYAMAVESWSDTGESNATSVQIAMDEIKTELKLDSAPDPSRAFDWSFVRR
jgi:ABC-type nitrate/sulfonate/bicarbonate transport system substrate-binding protein